jgi:hypothetical protein
MKESSREQAVVAGILVYRATMITMMAPENLDKMVIQKQLFWRDEYGINYDGISDALKSSVPLELVGPGVVKYYIVAIFHELKENKVVITPENLLEEAKNTDTWKTNLG